MSHRHATTERATTERAAIELALIGVSGHAVSDVLCR
ncbi:Ms4533A family Cys-rich leader peptide [Streptomyces cinereoruber]